MIFKRALLPFSVGLLVLTIGADAQVSQAGPHMDKFSQVKVFVNDDQVNFKGTGARMNGGRVLVPLRGIFEQLGAVVGWDEATQTVIADKDDIEVKLVIGENSALFNGKRVKLDAPAQINNGSTMVPLRFVSEALGASVEWDGSTRTVSIRSGNLPIPPGGQTRPSGESVDRLCYLCMNEAPRLIARIKAATSPIAME